MKKSLKQRRGFTLIEVLMVILIIGILTGLVLGIAGYANKKSAIAKTRALHMQLMQGLENYKNKWGTYPKAGNFQGMFSELYTKPIKNKQAPYVDIKDADVMPKKNSPYDDEINFGAQLYVQDAWANSFNYRCPGTHNPDSYDLNSLGPDLKANSVDDIKNW